MRKANVKFKILTASRPYHLNIPPHFPNPLIPKLQTNLQKYLDTNVSRPRHVRVEVNLTIFLEITQVNFLKKLTYPVNVFHV